jgi:glycosyltransferase involved in cell wall biosynthesis
MVGTQMVKRIGIDARMYGLAHAGIGRYIQNLIRELSLLDRSNQYVIFTSSQAAKTLSLPVNYTVAIAKSRHYTVSEQILFLNLIRTYSLDVIHFPHFNFPILWHHETGMRVTTLSPFKYHLKYIGYKLTVSQAVNRSQAIIVPSKWVKSQLLHAYPHIQSQKIAITYEGIEPQLHINKATQLSQSKKMLYIGSLYPHKNLPVVFDALQLLQGKGETYTLTIVSARDVFQKQVAEEVKKRNLEKYVSFTGFQTDQQLSQLSQSHLALVQPSRSEGFGLTGLEAMQLGLPVIAADNSAMPEIYGDAALYFSPDHPAQLSSIIKKVSHNHQLRKEQIAKGYERIRHYDWQKTAKHTLQIYKKVLA